MVKAQLSDTYCPQMDLCSEDSRQCHGNGFFPSLISWGNRHGDGKRKALSLNVLLLGERQSGRSSVGNALIGGQEFQTGVCYSEVSMTTDYRSLTRTFLRYFRRQGTESDLTLTVTDTPPLMPRPQSMCELCPEGVHVLVVVVRVDLPYDNPHLEQSAQGLFGPEWHHHAILVLTHTDHLEEAGLQPSVYLTQATESLRVLSRRVGGGVFFMDNTCDWPAIRGRPLRDKLLRLSAANHHSALRVRTEA
ncbi:GTPase IMAP family member GIMD1-like [Genypterus blacodes]|uniref:GTPase IMAP family member GIMD1-like n=1 Tax=Genypterus blacodes TaxID=154954 RepID=UPI003F7616EF